jgi:septum formation protein
VPPRLTLASRSPQRRAILTQLGIEFDVVVPGVEEVAEGGPEEIVLENARRKARAVEGELVLGVDTAVVLDSRAYGKPRYEREAETVLEALSGREHEVWSGVALRSEDELREASARTLVRFRTLERGLLDWYLASGEWRERAGGYAIQGRGAALVEAVEGDFWNVVGLPVVALLELAPELLAGSPGR